MSGFGRSNSLSINTGASNTLFGAAGKPPASGGLFGNATATPPTGGLFGQTATATTQPQSGGLFGQTTPAQPQQSGGGLFGNLQKPAQTPTTGLFGNAQQSQPPQSGSLFGATPAQNQPQTPAAGGGLFGNLGGQQNKPATPSLFGSNTTAQQQPSLLGSNATTTQQSGGLFGNMNQPAASGSLFGAPAAKPALSLGQSTAAPAANNSVAGVKVDLSNIKPTTRFSELHEEIQKEIVRIDELIQLQISYKDQISAAMPRHAENMTYVPNDVSYLTDRLELVESVLDNDAAEIQRIKETINQDAKDARLSFMAVENLKLPSQFHHTGMGFSLPSKNIPKSSLDDGETDSNNTDLTSYFNSKHAVLEQALQTHEKHISEIESHLKTVEVSTMQKVTRLMEARERGQVEGEDSSTRTQEGLKELGEALRAVETMILTLAGKVGEAREGVVEVTLGAVGR